MSFIDNQDEENHVQRSGTGILCKHSTGKPLRDKRFVAIHRGGNLSPENHRKLMKWAITCFEHVLPYYGREPEPVLNEAIHYAREWSRGACLTGDLIVASRNVHRFAKTITDPVASAVVRSIGQGVATGHMADHCVGAALYAQKAVLLAGNQVQDEKAWQISKLCSELPEDITILVIQTMQVKRKGLGLPDDT
ncbi:putative immunity protein [Methanospirillum lacunae]|uniref:putative immunity protein n=1 Tax=Methanospirillum lacunae TaxID=668570 RepID=UPI0011B1EFE9|nr:hypothetical protein [Methanospirillum lacunae]